MVTVSRAEAIEAIAETKVVTKMQEKIILIQWQVKPKQI